MTVFKVAKDVGHVIFRRIRGRLVAIRKKQPSISRVRFKDVVTHMPGHGDIKQLSFKTKSTIGFGRPSFHGSGVFLRNKAFSTSFVEAGAQGVGLGGKGFKQLMRELNRRKITKVFGDISNVPQLKTRAKFRNTTFFSDTPRRNVSLAQAIKDSKAGGNIQVETDLGRTRAQNAKSVAVALGLGGGFLLTRDN